MSSKLASYEGYRFGRHTELIKMTLAEELVSIESSERNEGKEQTRERRELIDSIDNLPRGEKEFAEEMNRLQKNNNRKFKEKWAGILAKYSQIDDETESDELDLRSGKIIRNNGHLMNLGTEKQSSGKQKYEEDIWSLIYYLENEESVGKTRVLRWQQEKNTGRAEKIARIRRPWDLLDVLLCRESSSLPKEGTFFKDGSWLSERSGYYEDISNNILKKSPEKSKLIFNGKMLTDPIRDRRSRRLSNETTDFYEKDALEGDLVSSTPLRKQAALRNDEEAHHEGELYFRSNLRFGPQNRGSFLPLKDRKKSTKSNGLLALLSNGRINESSHDKENGYLKEEDVGQEYLTGVSVDPKSPSKVKIYNCAFESCFFCTGNKLLYRDHLLRKHKAELEQVGYPIITTGVPKDLNTACVSEETILKLDSQFPLVCPVPSLPLSQDGSPYICKLRLAGSRRCQKSFLSHSSLVKHQKNYPSHCSLKRPLFACPLLGCGYATSSGYLTWRMHFIEAKHHIHPIDRRKYFGVDNRGQILREKSFSDNSHQKGYIFPSSPILTTDSRDNSINLSEKLSLDSSPSKGKVTLDGINKEIDDMFSDSESESSVVEMSVL